MQSHFVRGRGLFPAFLLVVSVLAINVRFLIAGLALGLLAAGGCAGPKVFIDFDPSAEFSAFRTFVFVGPTDRDQGGPLDDSLLRKRIEETLGRQLTAKGLRQVGMEDSSDLLVDFWVGVKDKQHVESKGMAGGASGGRYGSGAGYSGGTYEYREGTLIVDLAESSKKELVWRATIVAILRGSQEKNLELADKGVAKAFEDFPPAKKK
jgi:hypothetical protein